MRPPLITPAAGRAYQALAGARVLVEKINRTSISLARVLAGLGASLRLVDEARGVAAPGAGSAPERHGTIETYLTDAILPEDWEASQALRALGVRVEKGWDWRADPFDFDLLYADMYPPPTRPFIVEARRRGKPVSLAAELVMQLSPAPAIAVTGTAGKSSATHLIAALLAGGGLTTYVGRDNVAQNPWINYEILNRLEDLQPSGWLVTELTSSHLEYMRTSPAVAVATNLAPDHVEWHGNLERYFEAKAAILKHQSAGGWAILNHDDLSRSVLAPYVRGRLAWFSLETQPRTGIYLDGERIVARWEGPPQFIALASEAQVARPYLGNVLAAIGAALAAGVPAQAIRRALQAYRRLPRRQEVLGEVNGVRIVNDSMATTPKKAAASLQAFPDASLILIAGGRRQTSWSDGLHASPHERALLDEACRLAAQKARAVVLFGEAADDVREHLLAAGMGARQMHAAGLLEASAVAALALAAPGDTVLLAPMFYVLPRESDDFNAQVEAIRASMPA
jgi:UDP-N-acetylmuramoylalanine--D-glutamate ligase